MCFDSFFFFEPPYIVVDHHRFGHSSVSYLFCAHKTTAQILNTWISTDVGIFCGYAIGATRWMMRVEDRKRFWQFHYSRRRRRTSPLKAEAHRGNELWPTHIYRKNWNINLRWHRFYFFFFLLFSYASQRRWCRGNIDCGRSLKTIHKDATNPKPSHPLSPRRPVIAPVHLNSKWMDGR